MNPESSLPSFFVGKIYRCDVAYVAWAEPDADSTVIIDSLYNKIIFVTDFITIDGDKEHYFYKIIVDNLIAYAFPSWGNKTFLISTLLEEIK